MTRSAPLSVLLLCSSMLVCASLLSGCVTDVDQSAKSVEAKKSSDLSLLDKKPTDLESSVRQAQLLRLSGNYAEAIHILSQLMLVASDDPRVVGEYGKTLTSQGRAQEAVQFLGRAAELNSNDWTIYSALGVSYDQLGNQDAARTAYERALALKPGEVDVLNNYALSRMLANDPQTARRLMERAVIAGGGKDPKIARNIALINSLAPAPDAPPGLAYAVQKPAPSAPAHYAAMQVAPPIAPVTRVSATPLPAPNMQAATQSTASGGIVMQKVPFDPLAGKIVGKSARAEKPKAIAAKADVPAKDDSDDADMGKTAAAPATHAPRPLSDAATQKAAAMAEAAVKKLAAEAEAPKPETPKKDTAPAVKAAPAPHAVADAKPAAKPASAPTHALAAAKPAPRIAAAKPAVKTAAAPPPTLRIATD